MHYTVRHVTRFTYDPPISESVMEVRMQPRTELAQRCLRFDLSTVPRASVHAYRDALGNIVHHFDLPGRHSQLVITADAIVEFVSQPSLPEAIPIGDWAEIDAIGASGEQWDFLSPSELTMETPRLAEFEEALGLGRHEDPLTATRRIMHAIHARFRYRQRVTTVDSPIEHALESGEGVCQDFAHVMIACVRRLRIPCRYVSGYLFHGSDDTSAEGATHAWVEALMPELGWVGFDPTNDVVAGARHIRVAVGRDYADVPPTKGVFRGRTASELAVSVQVSTAASPPMAGDLLPAMTWTTAEPPAVDLHIEQQQQQQQQQQ
jgi:transglutaminase-like putative cysteine protease